MACTNFISRGREVGCNLLVDFVNVFCFVQCRIFVDYDFRDFVGGGRRHGGLRQDIAVEGKGVLDGEMLAVPIIHPHAPASDKAHLFIQQSTESTSIECRKGCYVRNIELLYSSR